jgi:hypothetical protein
VEPPSVVEPPSLVPPALTESSPPSAPVAPCGVPVPPLDEPFFPPLGEGLEPALLTLPVPLSAPASPPNPSEGSISTDGKTQLTAAPRATR